MCWVSSSAPFWVSAEADSLMIGRITPPEAPGSARASIWSGFGFSGIIVRTRSLIASWE